MCSHPSVDSTSHCHILAQSPEDAPIGVFDSGIGGLSILAALVQAMPGQRFIYLADTAYAPYGEKGDAYVIARSRHIAKWMHDDQHTKGLVIACNTATAAAVLVLREDYGSAWPIVGVEPAIKPAAILSQTGRIGIMATAGTLASVRFQTLMRRIHDNAQIPLQIFPCACNGLAEAIEHGNTPQIELLVKRYTSALAEHQPDVLVLGCTHYPFVADLIAQAMPGVRILDTGEAVARRACTVFNTAAAKTVQSGTAPSRIKEAAQPSVDVWTNAAPERLQVALTRWLPDVATRLHIMPAT